MSQEEKGNQTPQSLRALFASFAGFGREGWTVETSSVYENGKALTDMQYERWVTDNVRSSKSRSFYMVDQGSGSLKLARHGLE